MSDIKTDEPELIEEAVPEDALGVEDLDHVAGGNAVHTLNMEHEL
jgi:hypothetical protein